MGRVWEHYFMDRISGSRQRRALFKNTVASCKARGARALGADYHEFFDVSEEWELVEFLRMRF